LANGQTLRTCLAAIRVLILGGLAALVAWMTVASYGWSYRHDFPLLHYAAWLVDAHGVLPYRDLFEFNMPGTYLLHRMMGALAGWDPAGIRVFDLLWLALTALVAAAALRRFGLFTMGGGAVGAALLYLGHGPIMTLQREWLLPLLVAVALAASPGRSPFWRSAAVGMLVGLAATVKPHAALVLPVFVLHDVLRDATRASPFGERLRSALVPVSVGFLIPVGAVLAWVASYGGLGDFWAILTRYTPLYSDLTGKHRAVPDGERWRWILKDYLLLPRTWLVLAIAVPGLLIATIGERRPDVRRMAWLFGALTLTFTAYPLITGKL